MPSIITRGGMSAKALGFGASTGQAVYVEDVFSTYLYTGNNGASKIITNNIDLSGKGGLVWVKNRTQAFEGAFVDTIRGAGYSLFTSTTGAQQGPNGILTAFNSDGFTVGGTGYSNNGVPYGTWSFRLQKKFFAIATWTGNGASTQTVSHDLGSVPGMIISKSYSGATNWPVYHKSMNGGVNPEQYYLILDGAGQESNAVANWGNVAPTSTQFTVGGNNNVNGYSYIAYLFADQAGGFGTSGTDNIIACGLATTDSSGNLNPVTLGWEPQYILMKRTNNIQGWFLWDTMRGLSLTNQNYIQPNYTDVEYSTGSNVSYIYPNATGFAGSGNWFGGNSNLIYLAIRRGPMKTPTDATKVFVPVAYTGNSTGSTKQTLNTGFPPDLTILRSYISSNGVNENAYDRLRGNGGRLSTPSTAAQSTQPLWMNFTDNMQVVVGPDSEENPGYAGGNCISWNFRRAPGFMDEVCYTGTGSATTVAHNLGVVPELMILKDRQPGGNSWVVYHTVLGNTGRVILNSDAANNPSTTTFNSTSPTASVFTVGSNFGTNYSGSTYVAYLFATCAGVSKVGSYTGTGAAQNIDCGFAASARFILIKRTDSTGDWYTYDSARGISASSDPYLLLNSTAAEVTGTDYVNTYATGFSLTSSAPAGLNANGGTYIFLAIA